MASKKMSKRRRLKRLRRIKIISFISAVAVVLIIGAWLTVNALKPKTNVADISVNAVKAAETPAEDELPQEENIPLSNEINAPAPITTLNIAATPKLRNNPTGALPIIYGADTQEKVVAITIDDCFQASNLEALIDLTLNNNGKLTIFPIGKNLKKDNIREAVYRAYQNGFELENHSYGHKKLYIMDNQKAVNEVFDAYRALCYTVGGDYEVHFMRCYGGDGEECERTQLIAKEFGYKALAHWSYSGSDASLSKIKETLAPGMIYLFHTTDSDTEKLKEFIPYCTAQGYKLVTLNELFGYEPNAVTPLTQDVSDMTAPNSPNYVYDPNLQLGGDNATYLTPVEMKENDDMYSVMVLQEKLQKLKYLSQSMKLDANYGGKTVKAVKEFQQKNKLEPTGVADIETQNLIFSK